MTQFIDRRLNSKKKSAVNRQRFIQRYKNQIKKAVSDAIAKRSITDMDKGEVVNIPAKDISEPHFSLGEGGVLEKVFPGNKQYASGEHIERDKGGGSGSGSQSSNTGEGEDDFVFNLSREEFLDLYFEDLALPDLVRKDLAEVKAFQSLRAGFMTSGSPSNLSIVRSMVTAKSRRTALRGAFRKKLKEAEAELALLYSQQLSFQCGASEAGKGVYTEYMTEADAACNKTENSIAKSKEAIEALIQKIEGLKRKLSSIPFVDTMDLRYRNRIRVPKPSTQAVMFCIMDVSGSMDEIKKNVAKRFFILLYLFLTRTYEHIELVFIRHHTVAKEVNEEEFFYSRETGGTVVSSALELMNQIIQKRYPESAWNIYAAQASDGDNWNADSPHCQELLTQQIMPKVQYFAYIEIMPRHHQSLWESYLKVQDEFSNFAMQNIDMLSEIYPVFRELFKRKVA
jgi:uncharacterized sporulation protein YeaH/YhbH (DUF444 family)